MHAVFHYAMHLDPVGDLAKQAMKIFDAYAEHHTDENNWASPIDLIMKDGRHIKEFPEGVSDRYHVLPYKTRIWKRAILHAIGCVITDIGVYDFPIIDLIAVTKKQDKLHKKLMEMPFPKLVEKVNRDTSKKLQELYSKVIRMPTIKTGIDFNMDNYKRQRMAQAYEKFRESYRFPPFTTDIDSPYKYRAYDLATYKTDGEINAILRMDIHT